MFQGKAQIRQIIGTFIIGKGHMIKFHVGRTFPGGSCPERPDWRRGAVSGRPVQGRISMSWGVIMTSSTRPALAMALEDMVIRREMAMTEFKIMVK